MSDFTVNCSFCGKEFELIEGDIIEHLGFLVNEEFNLITKDCCVPEFKEELKKQRDNKYNLLQRIESLEAQLEELKNNNGG